MIFLDQLLKKASVQGPNLTSYEFQTKWRGSDFWLTAQYAVNFQHSAPVEPLLRLYLVSNDMPKNLVGYRPTANYVTRKLRPAVPEWDGRK